MEKAGEAPALFYGNMLIFLEKTDARTHDERLLSASKNYEVKISKRVSKVTNFQGHMLTLSAGGEDFEAC